jgi:hypothetical protein
MSKRKKPVPEPLPTDPLQRALKLVFDGLPLGKLRALFRECSLIEEIAVWGLEAFRLLTRELTDDEDAFLANGPGFNDRLDALIRSFPSDLWQVRQDPCEGSTSPGSSSLDTTGDDTASLPRKDSGASRPPPQ